MQIKHDQADPGIVGHIPALVWITKDAEVRFADLLPKTRSGKIMRRLLRELAQKGSITGDTTTLEDMSSVERLAQHKGQEE